MKAATALTVIGLACLIFLGLLSGLPVSSVAAQESPVACDPTAFPAPTSGPDALSCASPAYFLVDQLCYSATWQGTDVQFCDLPLTHQGTTYNEFPTCVQHCKVGCPDAPQADNLELLDPIPDLLSGTGITTDISVLTTLGRHRLGIAADGVAKLVLRFTATSDGTVAFALVDQDGAPLSHSEEDGSLITLGGNRPHTQNLSAFARYDAPSQFVRTSTPAADADIAARDIFIQTTFTPDNGGEPQVFCNPITVVRPPVVLIHGLFSGPSTWTALQTRLQAAIPGLKVFTADYELTNAAHYSRNRDVLKDKLADVRRELRTQGIAVVQADVMGHSMGGLLSRLWAGDTRYDADPDTLMSGDIHTLITIDSPHQGSFLADAVVFLLDSLPSQKRDRVLETARNFLNKPLDDGAIYDLTTSSLALRDMNSTSTQVPSHAVIGSVNAVSVPIDLSQLSDDTFGALFTILKFFGFNTTVTIPPSDLVVSVPSQQGGLVPPATSEFNDQHFSILQDLNVVQQAIIPLLNTPAFPLVAPPAGQPAFAIGFPTQ